MMLLVPQKKTALGTHFRFQSVTGLGYLALILLHPLECSPVPLHGHDPFQHWHRYCYHEVHLADEAIEAQRA